MAPGRLVWIGMAACAATLALAGCRERHVPDQPVDVAAESVPATRAAPLEPGRLRPRRPLLAPCSLDTVNRHFFSGVLKVSRSAPLQLRGWLPNEHHEPAGDFLLVLSGDGGEWAVQARTGTPRPDVTAALDALALGISGFEFEADLAPMPSGSYEIVLLQQADGASLVCDTAKGLLLI